MHAAGSEVGAMRWIAAHRKLVLAVVGALLATGAVLFFTAPSKKENVAFGFGPGSAFVKGTFQ